MPPKNSLSLFELAQQLKCHLLGDGTVIIDDVADLDNAMPTHLSFFTNERYLNKLKSSRAGAVIVKSPPKGCEKLNFLIHSDPTIVFEQAVSIFRQSPPSGFMGIHSTAIIHPSVEYGEAVTIGPYCVIDKNAKIGRKTCLSAHVFVGAESTIGANCHLYPHVVIREGCIIGNGVIFQPGSIVGSCGFGFIFSENEHRKQLQLGGVSIGDGVELGALTVVDRARIGQTVIESGTKIDNLVQVAHNVHIGTKNLIAAQSGLAGSCSTGSLVTIAGQSALVGHIKVTGGVTIAGKTGVSKNLLKRDIYAGIPAIPLEKWREQVVLIKNLSRFKSQLTNLQHRIQALETLKSNASKLKN